MNEKTTNKYGYFTGPVDTRWIENEPRDMMILEPVWYYEPDGTEWKISHGDIINGASIPRFLWTIFGPPFVGFYRRPAGFHDVACTIRDKPHSVVHRVFKTMLLCDNVDPKKAEMMYRAVKYFGPKW